MKTDIDRVKGKFNLSLSKIIGDEIVDVEGYVSCQFGWPVFRITRIIFASGFYCLVDGEHEIAYVVEPLDTSNLEAVDPLRVWCNDDLEKFIE